MFKDKDIICISTIDWDFLWQRHQIFMKMFAEQGNRVFYIENLNPSCGIGISMFPKLLKRIVRILFRANKTRKAEQLPPNLQIITPLLIPFSNPLADFTNKNILIRFLYSQLLSKGLKNIVVWTYLATPLSLQLIDALKPKFLIYDCVFDAILHPASPKNILESENSLIKRADLVFSDNQHLFKKCFAINPKTYLLPAGVDFQLFSSGPNSNKTNTNPKVCFFGGIEQIRIDLGLIEYAAQNRPSWDIMLVGPVIKTNVSRLKRLKNIHFVGTIEHKMLPIYLNQVDALILPYKIIPFSKSILPAKIFECLATGKPIIATPLDELKSFESGLFSLASNKEEFLQAIECALNNDSEESRLKRQQVAKQNSWESRYHLMQEIIKKREGKTNEK